MIIEIEISSVFLFVPPVVVKQQHLIMDKDFSSGCVVCLEEDQENCPIFIGCGHRCCCEGCINQLRKKICPLCRKDIIGTVYNKEDYLSVKKKMEAVEEKELQLYKFVTSVNLALKIYGMCPYYELEEEEKTPVVPDFDKGDIIVKFNPKKGSFEHFWQWKENNLIQKNMKWFYSKRFKCSVI